MKDPEENINHQEDRSLEIETSLETILEIVLEIHKTEIEGCQRRSNGSKNKSRNNSGDRSRNDRNDSKQKSNRYCECCDQGGHTWKYCWEMQANAKKARRLKEMDDRNDDPSDTFNSLVSEDPIFDDDLDGFIRM